METNNSGGTDPDGGFVQGHEAVGAQAREAARRRAQHAQRARVARRPTARRARVRNSCVPVHTHIIGFATSNAQRRARRETYRRMRT